MVSVFSRVPDSPMITPVVAVSLAPARVSFVAHSPPVRPPLRSSTDRECEVMDLPPKRERSRKEQMQLARNATLNAVSRAIAQDRTGTLTATTFHVVWRLLTYMGEAGEAFPAMATLAASLGMNERTVRDHLQRAVTSGVLKMRRDGRRKTNVYSLASDALVDSSVGVGGTGDCGTVTGLPAPETRYHAPLLKGAVNTAQSDTVSANRSLGDGGTGLSAQSHRVDGTKVTGAAGPTIHLEPNHLDDPQTKTLVRSSFGQSDELAREEIIRRLTLEVFNHTHGLGRERSRKSRIARALRELDRNGDDLGEVVRGTVAIMHGLDAHNEELGGHAAADKILRERRWESWTEDDETAFL